eukprot:5902435-Amphidinium_carterae.1
MSSSMARSVGRQNRLIGLLHGSLTKAALLLAPFVQCLSFTKSRSSPDILGLGALSTTRGSVRLWFCSGKFIIELGTRGGR